MLKYTHTVLRLSTRIKGVYDHIVDLFPPLTSSVQYACFIISGAANPFIYATEFLPARRLIRQYGNCTVAGRLEDNN